MFGCGLAVGLLVLIGVLVPRGGDAVPNVAGEGTRRIFILSNAIHTDLALPLDPDIRARFAFVGAAGLPIERPDAAWIVVGWGGRDFYLSTPNWSDLSAGPVFASIVGDRAVMHVDLLGAFDAHSDHASAIELSPVGLQRLTDAVLASFALDAAGAPRPIAHAGYGDFDRFFEAKGTFQLLFGCNVWTAEMLRRGGVATGLWTPLPVLLFAALDLHG